MVSRIARKPITIPSDVNTRIADGTLYVKGKLGELSHRIPVGIKVVSENGTLKFEPEAVGATKKTDIFIGTTHALAKNMLQGVKEGFSKTLMLVGVGYRAEVKGSLLKLTVGYSHPVEISISKGLTAKLEKPTVIVISGIDKQCVTQFAAKIREIRPPEPYKGKGIRYKNEVIKKKEVKKK